MWTDEKRQKYYAHWYKDRGRKRPYVPYKDRWEYNHRLESNTGKKVRYAVKTGKIIKPKKCEVCERETRVYAHHEDYNKVYDITWLCGSCHRKVHTGRIEIKKP